MLPITDNNIRNFYSKIGFEKYVTFESTIQKKNFSNPFSSLGDSSAHIRINKQTDKAALYMQVILFVLKGIHYTLYII